MQFGWFLRVVWNIANDDCIFLLIDTPLNRRVFFQCMVNMFRAPAYEAPPQLGQEGRVGWQQSSHPQKVSPPSNYNRYRMSNTISRREKWTKKKALYGTPLRLRITLFHYNFWAEYCFFTINKRARIIGTLNCRPFFCGGQKLHELMSF